MTTGQLETRGTPGPLAIQATLATLDLRERVRVLRETLEIPVILVIRAVPVVLGRQGTQVLPEIPVRPQRLLDPLGILGQREMHLRFPARLVTKEIRETRAIPVPRLPLLVRREILAIKEILGTRVILGMTGLLAMRGQLVLRGTQGRQAR